MSLQSWTYESQQARKKVTGILSHHLQLIHNMYF
jgi:hypothetical protein